MTVTLERVAVICLGMPLPKRFCALVIFGRLYSKIVLLRSENATIVKFLIGKCALHLLLSIPSLPSVHSPNGVSTSSLVTLTRPGGMRISSSRLIILLNGPRRCLRLRQMVEHRRFSFSIILSLGLVSHKRSLLTMDALFEMS